MSSGARLRSLPSMRAIVDARPGAASMIRDAIPTSSSLAATHSAAGRSEWVGLDVLILINSLSRPTTSSWAVTSAVAPGCE
jgi:hypothetical protein